MGQRILGINGVHRTGGWTVSQIFEALILTDDRVIVVRTAKGGEFGWDAGNVVAAWYKAGEEEEKLACFSPEELQNADEDNYNIPYLRIKKVELKKFGLGAFVNIITDDKEYNWAARGILGQKHPRIGDFEKILQPIFADHLSASK